MTHGTSHTACPSTVVALCVEELLIHVFDLVEHYSTGGNLQVDRCVALLVY